jgi:cell division protein FtsN
MHLRKTEEKIYVLRTNAYDTEYALDEWRARLEGEPLIVRGDAESGYYLTAGSYTTREEAENKLNEILSAGDMDLFIEEIDAAL